jgi:hypothetical protein
MPAIITARPLDEFDWTEKQRQKAGGGEFSGAGTREEFHRAAVVQNLEHLHFVLSDRRHSAPSFA